MDAWLERAAAMHPERVALVTGTQELRYAELARRARIAAGTLRLRGVKRGDRVALALSPGLDFVVALHGCLLLGAAAVPNDLRLGEAEQALRRAGTAAVVDGPLRGSGETAVDEGPLRGSPSERDFGQPKLGDLATVMYTSGTTASPRPVELTVGNWQANAVGSALALGLDRAERWLCAMPLAHVGGLSILIRSAIYATTVVLQTSFDAEVALDTILDPEQGITVVSLVPTQLQRLLDAGLADPPTLRWALLGGGPIAPALLARAAAARVPVAPTYGMTETCSQVATHGWPLLGAELRIGLDAELLVRGPMVAPGTLAPDGWLHTGDLARFDERGRLEIVGRKADTIISGGENIAPAEVEAVLLEHPDVADAAVFGREHPEWGEVVLAAVVPREGSRLDIETLREHCAARLARFKVPKSIEFVAQLPRTASGKLLRRELG